VTAGGDFSLTISPCQPGITFVPLRYHNTLSWQEECFQRNRHISPSLVALTATRWHRRWVARGHQWSNDVIDHCIPRRRKRGRMRLFLFRFYNVTFFFFFFLPIPFPFFLPFLQTLGKSRSILLHRKNESCQFFFLNVSLVRSLRIFSQSSLQHKSDQNHDLPPWLKYIKKRKTTSSLNRQLPVLGCRFPSQVQYLKARSSFTSLSFSLSFLDSQLSPEEWRRGWGQPWQWRADGGSESLVKKVVGGERRRLAKFFFFFTERNATKIWPKDNGFFPSSSLSSSSFLVFFDFF